MKTLAEHLGVRDPRQQDDDASSPRTAPRKPINEFCREVLASDEYRESLLRRIFLGELPPAIEALLYHYAHGKPVEKVEVRNTTVQIEELTAEQLEQRAIFLVECARKMRQETEQPEPAVH